MSEYRVFRTIGSTTSYLRIDKYYCDEHWEAHAPHASRLSLGEAYAIVKLNDMPNPGSGVYGYEEFN